MPRPRSKDECKKLCSGCRNDRYNHYGMCERPGVDAVVTSEYCWSLDPKRAVYCRATKEWALPCHSSYRQQWVAEYAKTGVKPSWKWY